MSAVPGMLPSSSAGKRDPDDLSVQIHVKDVARKLEKRKGPFCESVTHVNSAHKDWFARIGISKKYRTLGAISVFLLWLKL